MKPKTKLLLYHLMWSAEAMTRPTYRTLSGSFESWAYQNGFLQRIHALEKADLLESRIEEGSLDRVYRLTRKGALKALGGRNPEIQWSRAWDGKWRFILFDVPENRRPLRSQLRQTLQKAHFGCLQKSVWLSPDPTDHIHDELARLKVDASTLTLIEGRPCGGESVMDLVSSAWSFNEINRRYKQHQQHLTRLPSAQASDLPSKLKQWTEMERLLWATCMQKDPLLPEELLPKYYDGQKAWEHRVKIMRKAGTLMRKLHFDYSAK